MKINKLSFNDAIKMMLPKLFHKSIDDLSNEICTIVASGSGLLAHLVSRVNKQIIKFLISKFCLSNSIKHLIYRIGKIASIFVNRIIKKGGGNEDHSKIHLVMQRKINLL